MAAFGGAPASDAPEPASDPPVPSLQRAVSAHTHSVLGELADECICPCSHGLMVDPVIASDGVSYDRASIEHWFAKARRDGVPPTSPQTNLPLPDDRLVPNLAVRRTITRLIESGRLDAEILEEYRETRAALEEARATGKRTEALKMFPIGSKVFLRVAFESVGAEEISVNVNDADLEFSGRLVFRSIGFRRLGSEGGAERRVLFEIEAAKLLQKLVPLNCPKQLQRKPDPAPLPEAELLDRLGMTADDDFMEANDQILFHLIERLATDGGLEEATRSEFKMIATATRRNAIKDALERALRHSTGCFLASIDAVNAEGKVTLRIESYVTVPPSRGSRGQAGGDEPPAAAPIVWETVEEPARTFEMPYASHAMMNAQKDSEMYRQKHARLFGMVSVPEGGGGNGGGRGRGRGGGRGRGRGGGRGGGRF